MEITKALCLSTTHISPETAKWLDGKPSTTWNETPIVDPLPFSVWASEYGWFMSCHILDYKNSDITTPADLLACIAAASAAGCDFLRLDSDGPIDESLKDFGDEWPCGEIR